MHETSFMRSFLGLGISGIFDLSSARQRAPREGSDEGIPASRDAKAQENCREAIQSYFSLAGRLSRVHAGAECLLPAMQRSTARPTDDTVIHTTRVRTYVPNRTYS